MARNIKAYYRWGLVWKGTKLSDKTSETLLKLHSGSKSTLMGLLRFFDYRGLVHSNSFQHIICIESITYVHKILKDNISRLGHILNSNNMNTSSRILYSPRVTFSSSDINPWFSLTWVGIFYKGSSAREKIGFPWHRMARDFFFVEALKHNSVAG